MPTKNILRRKSDTFETYEIPADDGGYLVIGLHLEDQSLWVCTADPAFPMVYRKPQKGIAPTGSIYYMLLELWLFAQKNASMEEGETYAFQRPD